MQLMPTEDTTYESGRHAAETSASAGTSWDRVQGNDERLRVAFDQHFDFVWRLFRRLGVREASAYDAAQQVFLTLSTKLPLVEQGKERAFLTGTAFRVASNQRRGERRSHESAEEEPIARAIDPGP